MIPRFDSVCPIRAVSFSSRKWHAIAISQPPPRAWPLMAAITGFGKRSIFRITLLPKRMKVSTLPPENAEPRAALSSVTSSALIAFAGGRFRVTTTNLSSRANCKVSNAIGRDSFEEDRRDRLGCVGEAVDALAEDPRRRQLVHRAEEHLGGDLERQVAPDAPGRHALLEHGLDHVEVGGDFVGGGAAEELLPLAELDLDDLGEVGALLDHPEVERDDLADLRERIVLRGDLLPGERHPLGHLLAEERDEDVVLGLEVEIDRAARDSCLARDVRDARVVVAVAREDADRGVDDRLRLVRIAH